MMTDLQKQLLLERERLVVRLHAVDVLLADEPAGRSKAAALRALDLLHELERAAVSGAASEDSGCQDTGGGEVAPSGAEAPDAHAGQRGGTPPSCGTEQSHEAGDLSGTKATLPEQALRSESSLPKTKVPAKPTARQQKYLDHADRQLPGGCWGWNGNRTAGRPMFGERPAYRAGIELFRGADLVPFARPQQRCDTHGCTNPWHYDLPQNGGRA